jgi:hypothetical protein
MTRDRLPFIASKDKKFTKKEPAGSSSCPRATNC